MRNSSPFSCASVGSAPLVLTENVAPTIVSAAAATSIVGAPFSTTVVTTGAPVAALKESGSAHCGIEELCAVEGVGEAKAAQVKAALELGKRSLASPLSTGTRISSSRVLFEHYHPALRNLRHEIFKVVLLDAKHAILRDATVSEGSLTLSIVHPREVFTMAVKESAAAVIFLHNHPSGDPTPSQEDHVLTARLVSAGDVLGIRVLDHLVVGDGRYVSFADEGWLTHHA